MPSRGWIQTASGRQVFVLEPDPAVVVLEDLAHALAAEVRYTGHTPFPYSVAQHSVLVAGRVDALGAERRIVAAALLHDAAEAYLKDIPSPLKPFLSVPELGIEYADLEEAWRAVIFRRFGLPEPLPEVVKRVDLELLATEARAFFPEYSRPAEWNLRYAPLELDITRWTFEHARSRFLDAAGELGLTAARPSF